MKSTPVPSVSLLLQCHRKSANRLLIGSLYSFCEVDMSDKKEKVALVLNYSLKEVFRECSPEQAQELIIAMIEYDQSGIDPEFTDAAVKLIWVPIRQDLDKKRANHKKVSDERAAAGATGGRGNKKTDDKKQNEANESKKSNCFSEKQNEAKKADSDLDLDCDYDKGLTEMNTSATTGAQEDLSPRDIGAKYREAFGEFAEEGMIRLHTLIVSYGARDVAAAVDTAAQRDPPPVRPLDYIASCCADWLEQRERAAPGGNSS